MRTMGKNQAITDCKKTSLDRGRGARDSASRKIDHTLTSRKGKGGER